MVLLYGEAGGNVQLARDLWTERFPNRRVPQGRTFISTVQHLRNHGTFNLREHILNRVEKEPGISTGRFAAEVGVPHFIVHRTLREQGLHPYHVKNVQALQLGDPPRRMNYCQWLLEQCRQEPNFFKNVLFTGEAGFTRNGV
ncbi:hypothetical protein BDFB_000275 [Asbolus verrucosus]|uniref:DUF4817 domain-containing protein n=1 Tax=Asbolus verrucosus TaxID=1661398 RepID=A0A482V6R1_ASBVE|nr:hypothetical protein BDFB_000275 [Asbolus verrucosus]